MRSVVPIVESSHGDVATQSPARGWAPPTTTTVRAPGKRSLGRCLAGAWASKAAASAMPTTVAPALRACALRCFVAFVAAGPARSPLVVGGLLEMLFGSAGARSSVIVFT